MATPVNLVTGLGGAIGCDYRPTTNSLVFVEYNGKVSRLNLIPTASVLNSGTATIPGTYLFDFDTGKVCPKGSPLGPPYDVFWQQQTSTKRSMTPINPARIVNIGVVSFASITYATLLGLSYSSTPIVGNVGASNKLVNGDVFAVKTTGGNYAKVRVISYGYNIKIQWVTYHVNSGYQVLGTGYTTPEDIKVCSNETFAYVTERSGNFLRIKLTSANRSSATVVSSGMTAPHQIVLDEDHNQAYVVEHATNGRLIRIDLATGSQTVLASNFKRATGLILTNDHQFAYVTEQSTAPNVGCVTRIHLSTGNREVIVTGLTNPFYMTWTDAGESGILITERDPANRITRINLAESPVTTSTVASGVPARPSSVAVMADTQILICSDSVISQLDLIASVYQSTAPMLMGVGFVPVDRISRHTPLNPVTDGYADTTVDPGYFYQVKDTPFGGSMLIMFNHERAYADGARYYKLLVDGVEPKQTWSDYLWSTSANRFVLQQMSPSAGGYYKVRLPGEVWYNHWLGYILNSTGLSNGLRKIAVKLFATQSAASEIGSAGASGRSMVLKIDNNRPQASIDEIRHDGAVVGTCAIVDSGSDAFTFKITAQDPEQHLKSWSLVAWWGDNKSKLVDQDDYKNHVVASKKWAGYIGFVPVVAPSPWHATVPGDPTSKQCAHTFYLRVWDRVINGRNYIHYAQYHKSITLMLP